MDLLIVSQPTLRGVMKPDMSDWIGNFLFRLLPNGVDLIQDLGGGIIPWGVDQCSAVGFELFPMARGNTEIDAMDGARRLLEDLSLRPEVDDAVTEGLGKADRAENAVA